MRHLGALFLLLPLIGILLDYYIYRIVKARFAIRYRHRYVLAVWVQSLIATVDAVALFCLPLRDGGDGVLRVGMWMLFIYLTLFIPKLLFCIIDVLAKLPLLWHNRRMKWLSWTAFGVAVISFAAMWWGALVNRLRIDVSEVTVVSDRVPAAFEGYRIVQFSDFHVGTYGTDTSYVSHVVERINSLEPDLILFTGDIVNRHSAEFEPFVSVMRRLRATDGVMAILGNHDYGDYHGWNDDAEREADVDNLKALFRQADITLLCDSARNIIHRGDTLTIVGVNNISEPQFQTYGSLEQAYPADGGRAKILMSHNPEHWRRDISGRAMDAPRNDFFLTLSGHTHAMQFEVCGFSPAAWVYPLWGGLYDDGYGHNLYVNIGLGTVGYPMRIGATPELTLITLSNRL